MSDIFFVKVDGFFVFEGPMWEERSRIKFRQEHKSVGAGWSRHLFFVVFGRMFDKKVVVIKGSVFIIDTL